MKNYNYFQFILSKASCCSQVGNSSPRSLVKLLLATLNNAFDSPLLERTTTSVEKPTRKNSWFKQLVPDCSKSHLLLLLFALITSVAYRVVQSDIFPRRSQCIPNRSVLLRKHFWWRWAELNRRPRNLLVPSYNHKTI